MMTRLLWIVAVVSLVLTAHLAQAQESECTLTPRLIVGEEGRVLQDILVNVRETPGLSGTNIGRMPAAGMFTVLDGPRCVDGYQWWQVDYHHARDGMVGWIAEGDGQADEYWLEPRGLRTLVTDADGGEHYYVELPDGNVEPEGCLAPPEDYTRVW
ncbi:MAG: SH3 domain-containing protein, partial [Anaerolineae bacterium]